MVIAFTSSERWLFWNRIMEITDPLLFCYNKKREETLSTMTELDWIQEIDFKNA